MELYPRGVDAKTATWISIAVAGENTASMHTVKKSGELKTLGRNIGRNKHVNHLELVGPRTDQNIDTVRKNFNHLLCKGGWENTSIVTLKLKQFHHMGKSIINLIGPILEHVSSLTWFEFHGPIRTLEEMELMFSFLLRRKNALPNIRLSYLNADAMKGLSEGMKAFQHYPGLTPTYLHLNFSTGADGCQSLASFLKHPTCLLKSLHLTDNPDIDDDALAVLAKALKTNKHLQTLSLYGCDNITKKGCQFILDHAICDISSINETFCSNHKLVLHLGQATNVWRTSQFKLYNVLNQYYDKQIVACKKVVCNHFLKHNWNTEIFSCMGPSLLIQVVEFLDKNELRCYAQSKASTGCTGYWGQDMRRLFPSLHEYNCARHTVLFELVKNVPHTAT